MDSEMEKMTESLSSITRKLNSSDWALRDDVILVHWGSALLQLSTSDRDSLDRVVALSQWASMAFSDKARRDQAKCFLSKCI